MECWWTQAVVYTVCQSGSDHCKCLFPHSTIESEPRRLLITTGGIFFLLADLNLQTRIIYRLVEHSSSPIPSNSLLFDEWYFYVFEASPMLLAIGIMNATHPGKVLSGPESELPRSALWQRCKCCASKRKVNGSEYVEIQDFGAERTAS